MGNLCGGPGGPGGSNWQTEVLAIQNSGIEKDGGLIVFR